MNSVLGRYNSAPDFSAILSSSNHPAEIILFLNLGMRRAAADLEMIRLLIYYGRHEAMNDEIDVQKNNENHLELYPELKSRAERILALDPSFVYVRLYASGALAFNLARPDEALNLLKEGLRFDPQNETYKAYIAAIAFSSHGDPEKVVETLTPYLKNKDCPSMLKNIMAFLYLKLGQPAQAAELYKDLLFSRDAGYQKTAREMLQAIATTPASKLRLIFKK
jgi:tetratricopeptide (TPR) repeat protein